MRWHRARDGGRVHAFPDPAPGDPLPGSALVSLCALVVVDEPPAETEHDPSERCGRCAYRTH